MRVHDLLADDAPREDSVLAVGHLESALDREHHVLRGQLGPVVKAHAPPQPELPGGRVERPPGDGETRNEARVFVHVGERIEDVPGYIDVRRDGEEVRVHRGHVRREADAQLGAVGGQARQNRARGEDAEQAAHGVGSPAYFAASGPMTRSI